MEDNTQIVIPMSGNGQRFIDAGFPDPKPLIEVQGRPIIDWVVSTFPHAKDLIFICRDNHLKETRMKEILTNLAPHGKIISIEGHKKGPCYAVAKAYDHIDDEGPVLISYCDYYMQWDYKSFIKEALQRNCDGAIPCYTGFHPHLLPTKNLYASCKIDSDENLVEIKEKFSWTENKMQSLQSPGAYYFKSGAIMKKYLQALIDDDIELNGEFYVSLVYNKMVEEGQKIWVPANVTKFCQWGTPHDLNEYLHWTNTIKGFKND